MPSAKRVAWAQLKVGILAIAAMAILVVLVFLLTGTKGLFSKDVTIYTFLDDAAALTEGVPVRLNGYLVGKVAKVGLSGENLPRRIIRVDMEVGAEYLVSIPDDSRTSVTAENVLGTKFINIKKGKSPQAVKPGGELPSLDTQEFDELVASGYSTLNSMQAMIRRLDGIVSMIEAGKGTIGKLLVDEELYNRANAIASDAQKVSGALASGKGTVGRLLYDDSLYESLRASVARVDNLLDSIQQGEGTAGKLLKDPRLYDDMRSSVAEIRKLLADLNAGKGTAGKLLKSEEMHRQIAATIARMDTLLERINTGQGTMGQLLVNPQLYESLNGFTRETHALIKDFRANPKKFLHIKLGLF